jgi:preprotein translocase subunit YajC
MKVGDKVITSGGIYGRIKEIHDDSVLLEIDENVRVRVDKNSVFATAADTQNTK